jgi:uncharacterized membrane protein
MIQWQFIGRLHPLVLHLPIGLVFGLLLIEGMALFSRTDASTWQRCRRAFIVFFAMSAVAAAATGYILNLEQQNTGDTVRRHMWLGLAVVALGLLLSTLTLSGGTQGTRLRTFLRLLVLAALVPATAATGHLGGQLTHGPRFLSAYAPAFLQQILEWPAEEPAGPPSAPSLSSPLLPPDAASPLAQPSVTVYARLIQPILADHCVMCHGPQRQRGRLAVQPMEALMLGGGSGPAIVPGRSQDSELIKRILLPAEDPGHMPPAGKSPLIPAEISALQWWIDEGASVDAALIGDQVPADIQSLLPETGTAPTPAEARGGPAAVDEGLLQPLIDRQVSVQRIQQQDQGLWISFPADARQVTDDTLGDLLPIASSIVWLDLSNTRITSQALPLIARMPALVELNLRHTDIRSEALTPLANHPRLERLNLSLTPVDDHIVTTLLAIPNLKRVYLGGTRVSAAARQRLAAPRIEVIGEASPSEIIEVDPNDA